MKKLISTAALSMVMAVSFAQTSWLDYAADAYAGAAAWRRRAINKKMPAAVAISGKTGARTGCGVAILQKMPQKNAAP